MYVWDAAQDVHLQYIASEGEIEIHTDRLSIYTFFVALLCYFSKIWQTYIISKIYSSGGKKFPTGVMIWIKKLNHNL